jgi:hypothetical protein
MKINKYFMKNSNSKNKGKLVKYQKEEEICKVRNLVKCNNGNKCKNR